jgi:hypothetical protein
MTKKPNSGEMTAYEVVRRERCATPATSRPLLRRDGEPRVSGSEPQAVGCGEAGTTGTLDRGRLASATAVAKVAGRV